MTVRPVETKLREWAERHFTAEFLDSLLLPVIADMQYEQRAAVEHGWPLRQWIRLRGYTSFAKALGSGMLLKRGRGVMSKARTGQWLTNSLSPAARLVAGGLLLFLSVPAVVANGRLIAGHSAGGLYFGTIVLEFGAAGVLAIVSGLRSMRKTPAA